MQLHLYEVLHILPKELWTTRLPCVRQKPGGILYSFGSPAGIINKSIISQGAQCTHLCIPQLPKAVIQADLGRWNRSASSRTDILSAHQQASRCSEQASCRGTDLTWQTAQ